MKRLLYENYIINKEIFLLRFIVGLLILIFDTKYKFVYVLIFYPQFLFLGNINATSPIDKGTSFYHSLPNSLSAILSRYSITFILDGLMLAIPLSIFRSSSLNPYEFVLTLLLIEYLAVYRKVKYRDGYWTFNLVLNFVLGTLAVLTYINSIDHITHPLYEFYILMITMMIIKTIQLFIVNNYPYLFSKEHKERRPYEELSRNK